MLNENIYDMLDEAKDIAYKVDATDVIVLIKHKDGLIVHNTDIESLIGLGMLEAAKIKYFSVTSHTLFNNGPTKKEDTGKIS